VCCQCVAEQGDVVAIKQSDGNDVAAEADKEKDSNDGCY
jgi:hypothetical protein